MFQTQGQQGGELRSPGGFIFGVQNWTWRDPIPTTVTFYLDNTAQVSDQYGRPMRGVVQGGKEVLFAPTPPIANQNREVVPRPKYATHQQVIAALAAEGVDWRTLTWAGWPQLPAEELKKLDPLPPTPADSLKRIVDPALRKAALRARAEADEAELQAAASEAE